MRKNILFGEIQVRDKTKLNTIKNAVFIEGEWMHKGFTIIQVISSKIIGQTNTSKEYTEVKASNEKRNKITGTYE